MTKSGHRGLIAGVKARFAKRRHFGTMGSFLVWMYDRVLCRRPGLPLPLRGALRGIRVQGVKRPVHVRLGTTDFNVLEEVFFDDEYGELLRAAPADVRTIVDLGANVGLSVRLWQERYPNARIMAVEPDAQNMAVTRRNAEEGAGAIPVSLIQACIAGTKRQVSLDKSSGEWAYKMTEASGSTPSMEAIPLEEALERAGISDRVDILKCDIEGAEKELFAGCRAWLHRIGTMVVELHADYTLDKFLADIEAGGGGFTARTLKQMPGVSVVLLTRQAK